MKVKYKKIPITLLKGGNTLLDEAAEFATGIGEDKLITISVIQGAVVIWYWE